MSAPEAFEQLDHAEYARRSLAWVAAKNAELARLDGLVMLDREANAPAASGQAGQGGATEDTDTDTDTELWNRIGRVLRARDPEAYREIRTAALAFAVMTGEIISPQES